MKINGINNLDVGMSNIEIEGEVTYTMAPRFVEGDNEKGHYEFYSQFVVIEDETGKIGCSITIEKEEYKLEKGVIARVKGKLEEYKDKKGQMVKKIQGKLVGISKGGKVTDVQQEVAEEFFEEKRTEAMKNQIIKENKLTEKIKANQITSEPIDKNDIWEAKDLRIARECAVKAVTELAVAKIITGTDFFHFANTIVKYIYNGKVNGKEKKSILHDNRQPLEVISEEPLFPAEEIENAVNEREKEEQGSFDNPIKTKLKRKAISKAEDFIAPADMPE